jgi:predicted transcriptional regulator
MPSLVAFRQLIRDDRERLGLSLGRASWLLGVSVRRYRELEEGEEYPSHREWLRMVEVFEWPRSFGWDRRC